MIIEKYDHFNNIFLALPDSWKLNLEEFQAGSRHSDDSATILRETMTREMCEHFHIQTTKSESQQLLQRNKEHRK